MVRRCTTIMGTAGMIQLTTVPETDVAHDRATRAVGTGDRIRTMARHSTGLRLLTRGIPPRLALRALAWECLLRLERLGLVWECLHRLRPHTTSLGGLEVAMVGAIRAATVIPGIGRLRRQGHTRTRAGRRMAGMAVNIEVDKATGKVEERGTCGREGIDGDPGLCPVLR